MISAMTTTRRVLGAGPQSEQQLPEESQEWELQGPRFLPVERVAAERAAVERPEEPAAPRARRGRRPLGPRGG